jgi:hypothetical protein
VYGEGPYVDEDAHSMTAVEINGDKKFGECENATCGDVVSSPCLDSAVMVTEMV